jgi:hypothetical protein
VYNVLLKPSAALSILMTMSSRRRPWCTIMCTCCCKVTAVSTMTCSRLHLQCGCRRADHRLRMCGSWLTVQAAGLFMTALEMTSRATALQQLCDLPQC